MPPSKGSPELLPPELLLDVPPELLLDVPPSSGGGGIPYSAAPLAPLLDVLPELLPLELLVLELPDTPVVSPPHAATAVAPASRIAARERREPIVTTARGDSKPSGSTDAQNGHAGSSARTWREQVGQGRRSICVRTLRR